MEKNVSRGNERGMTLIEVLVSTLVLSAVVVSSASIIGVTLRRGEIARVRTTATSLAAERLEQLTTMRWRSAPDYAEYQLAGESLDAGPPEQLIAGYGDIEGYPEFRRVVTLDYDVPTAGMLKVSVDVFWQDLQRGEMSHRLITFLHPTLHTGL